MKSALILAASLMVVAGCANASPVSGVYIAKYPNHVLFVQIVKTPDGHATGRIEEVILQADGSFKDNAYPLDGSIDGDQISLKSNVLFGMGDTYSGTVDGMTLHIVYANGQATLYKSDANAFTKAKADLQNSGNATIAKNERAKIEAQRKADYDDLASVGTKLDTGLTGFFANLESTSDTTLAKFQKRHDTIIKKYQRLESKIAIHSIK